LRLFVAGNGIVGLPPPILDLDCSLFLDTSQRYHNKRTIGRRQAWVTTPGHGTMARYDASQGMKGGDVASCCLVSSGDVCCFPCGCPAFIQASEIGQWGKRAPPL